MEETTQQYLHLETKGYVGIHYFSVMNNFMDCLVWVKSEEVPVAKQCISDGIKEFYDSSSMCYGEAIEFQLSEKGIEYQIEFDSMLDMLDEDTDETSQRWNKYAGQYESYTHISD